MDEDFLREAITLSEEKMLAGEGGPFGAVVVREGQIIGRGWNRVTSTSDPTAHAEIVAIRDACQQLQTFSLEGCTLYSSCEPCPMCLGAIYWSRVDRLVFAAGREDAAAAGFDDAFFYDEFSKPLSGQKLPARQLLREDALEAFRLWRAKVDRQAY